MVQLQEMKAPLDVTQMVDPSVCATCGGDAGSGAFGLVGGAPFCPGCTEKLYNRDFPSWLKLGLAFTLLLLVVALVQGAPYFKTGQKLFRAEHMVEAGRYAGAVPLLADAVAAAPNCEKCILLYAKAALTTGAPDKAYSAAMGHNEGKFETSKLFNEVEVLFKKADRAGELLEQAGKEMEAKHSAEALRLIQEARGVYPEWNVPTRAEESLVIADAFDKKDYETFVAKAEAIEARDKDAYSAAQVASALACKYAVSGNEAFRSRSEEMLRVAQERTDQSEEAQRHLQEYGERIRHRLDTRVIMDKEEYDRTIRRIEQEAPKQ